MLSINFQFSFEIHRWSKMCVIPTSINAKSFNSHLRFISFSLGKLSLLFPFKLSILIWDSSWRQRDWWKISSYTFNSHLRFIGYGVGLLKWSLSFSFNSHLRFNRRSKRGWLLCLQTFNSHLRFNAVKRKNGKGTNS